jgi:hypothetical protein
MGNLCLQKNPSSMWGWGQLWGHLFRSKLTFIFVIISLWILFGSDQRPEGERRICCCFQMRGNADPSLHPSNGKSGRRRGPRLRSG